jgi:hypothetical protein
MYKRSPGLICISILQDKNKKVNDKEGSRCNLRIRRGGGRAKSCPIDY